MHLAFDIRHKSLLLVFQLSNEGVCSLACRCEKKRTANIYA